MPKILTVLGVLLAVLAVVFALAGVGGGNAPLMLTAGGVVLVGVGALTGQ